MTREPLDKLLTTEQAADLLNMSREYLGYLLDQGEIPATSVTAGRRVRLDDLMRYRAERDRTRREALRTLTRLAQESGEYT